MSSTRLLILGAVRILQPVHGYEVKRELDTWSVEAWTNLATGSIYHALGQMAREGLLEEVESETVGKRPRRTTYRLTRWGEETFQRLLREHWWERKPIIDPFMVAWNFMPVLPRDELLAGLRHRMAGAQHVAAASAYIERQVLQDAPPHVEESIRLMTARVTAEIEWCERVIARVEAGELPGEWKGEPAPRKGAP